MKITNSTKAQYSSVPAQVAFLHTATRRLNNCIKTEKNELTLEKHGFRQRKDKTYKFEESETCEVIFHTNQPNLAKGIDRKRSGSVAPLNNNGNMEKLAAKILPKEHDIDDFNPDSIIFEQNKSSKIPEPQTIKSPKSCENSQAEIQIDNSEIDPTPEKPRHRKTQSKTQEKNKSNLNKTQTFQSFIGIMPYQPFSYVPMMYYPMPQPVPYPATYYTQNFGYPYPVPMQQTAFQGQGNFQNNHFRSQTTFIQQNNENIKNNNEEIKNDKIDVKLEKCEVKENNEKPEPHQDSTHSIQNTEIIEISEPENSQCEINENDLNLSPDPKPSENPKESPKNLSAKPSSVLLNFDLNSVDSDSKPSKISLADAFAVRRKTFVEKISKVPKKEENKAKTRSKDEILKQRKEMMKSKISKRPPTQSIDQIKSLKIECSTLGSSSTCMQSIDKGPKPELIERLAAGKKPVINKETMKKLTERNYKNLPEVVKKREEELKKQINLQRIKLARLNEKVIFYKQNQK